MGYGMWGGLGDGLREIGSRMYDDDARKKDEASYMRKMEASEKARDARDAADRARQAELEKTTPVGRNVYQGPEGESRVAITNRGGGLLGDELALPHEAQGLQSGLRATADARREKESAAAQKQANFERTDTRLADQYNRTDKRIRDTPRGGASQKSLSFQKDADGNILGIDPDTGEVKTKNGKPVGKSGGGSMFSRSEDGSYNFE